MKTTIPSKNLPAVARHQMRHCMPGQRHAGGGGAVGPQGRLVDIALDAAGLGPPIVTLKIGFGGHDRVSLHAVRGTSGAPSSARQCRQYRRTLFRDRDVASAGPGGDLPETVGPLRVRPRACRGSDDGSSPSTSDRFPRGVLPPIISNRGGADRRGCFERRRSLRRRADATLWDGRNDDGHGRCKRPVRRPRTGATSNPYEERGDPEWIWKPAR